MGRAKEEEFSLRGCLVMVFLALVFVSCIRAACKKEPEPKPIRNTTAEQLLSAAERDADAFNQDWEHHRPRISGHVVNAAPLTFFLYLGTPETKHSIDALEVMLPEYYDWKGLQDADVTVLCEHVGAYISRSKWGDSMNVQATGCKLEARD